MQYPSITDCNDDKDVPGQMVPMIVNYYFIDTPNALFKALEHALEAAKSSKNNFTLHAPQWLQIFTRSPYIMLQNILNKA